ncbi:MAG: hypothetical protein HYZ73_05605, partial [Elusimicrobia bacterium]|nr:hypothetical protein [Elusimicrobiota bacterium]
MIQVPAPDFSLRETLECGQAFRWTAKDSAYYGFIQNAAVRATVLDSRLVIETVDSSLSAEAVRHYFALDVELLLVARALDVRLSEVPVHVTYESAKSSVKLFLS